VSLILAPSPCVYRKRAISALESEGWQWRATYTSPSVSGQLAALRAGLGVTVLPLEMVPPDLTILSKPMPPLADTEIALLRARTAVPPAAERLAEFILSSLDRRASA
jgi:DNA-binding transcriptional LysR family regulator